MTSVEVHMKAYDVLEAALLAGSVEAAIEPVRAELEVLARGELVRVAMALAVEAVLKLPPTMERPKLAKRIERARAEAMWAGS